MGSFLDRDRVFRAVRRTGAGAGLEVGWDVTVDQDEGITHVIDVEHVRRERVTAVMPLTLFLVNANAHVKLSSCGYLSAYTRVRRNGT